jgi:hypothetical protein
LFCKLMTKETVEGRLAVTVRRDRSSMTVGVASGGAPASRVVLTAVVEVGILPPSGGLAQEGPTRQRDDSG